MDNGPGNDSVGRGLQEVPVTLTCATFGDFRRQLLMLSKMLPHHCHACVVVSYKNVPTVF